MLHRQPHANDVVGRHRLEEAQIVEAVIRQQRPRRRIDEQSRGKRQDQVAVGDAAREERVGLGRHLIHMRVKIIAGEFRKMLDVG